MTFVKTLILIIAIIISSCKSPEPIMASCGTGMIRVNYPIGNITLIQDGFYNSIDSSVIKISTNDSCNSLPVLLPYDSLVYPEIAKRAGVEGNVKVKLIVNQNGNVLSSIIVQSDAELFNKNVLDGVKQFQYLPYKSNCKSEMFAAVLTISFILNRTNIK